MEDYGKIIVNIPSAFCLSISVTAGEGYPLPPNNADVTIQLTIKLGCNYSVALQIGVY